MRDELGLATPDSSSVIVVIGVIAGTVLNEAVIHIIDGIKKLTKR